MNTYEKVLASIVGTVFLAPVVALILYIAGWHIQTGEGEHTGYVTATETTGIFYKTKRAFLKTDTQSSQEDMYCVLDETAYEKLQQAQTSKEKVTVQYIDWLAKGIKNCGGEQGGVITGVK